MNKDDILDLICSASEKGNLGLFVGSGFSKAVVTNGREYPAYTWKDLLRVCCKKMGVSEEIVDSSISNPEIASQICRIYASMHANEGKTYSSAVDLLKKIIASIVSVFPTENDIQEYVKFFNSIEVSWIVTTNYDTVLESILKDKAYPIGPEDCFVKQTSFIPIYHIHGLRYSPQGIVITNEDYAKLFRPNDYRQARLPFLMKESLVLMIGYSLGDLNVLTAVDWSKNVYKSEENSFPIIQLLYKEDGACVEPYQDQSGIWVVEISSILDFFDELILALHRNRGRIRIKNAKVRECVSLFRKCNEIDVNRFIDDKLFRNDRLSFITSLDREYNFVYLEFESFLHEVMRECGKRAEPFGAFNAYDERLKVLLDIICQIPFKKMPVSFFAFIAKELDDLAFYIDDKRGTSYAALDTWNKDAKNIPEEMFLELKRYSSGKDRRFAELDRILGLI